MEDGDLADEGAINLSLPLNPFPRRNKNYFVGLQRDEFMWIESGNLLHRCEQFSTAVLLHYVLVEAGRNRSLGLN